MKFERLFANCQLTQLDLPTFQILSSSH